jgi:hypothetical protein
MPEENLVAVGHEKAPTWLQAIKIGAQVRLVRASAYP